MMPKKVIDIFPPGKSKQALTSFPEKRVEKTEPADKVEKIAKIEKVEKIVKEEKPISPPRKKKGFFKRILLLLPVILVLVFLVFQFFLDRAKIDIWPKTETFSIDEKITIDAKISQLDPLAKVIPGRIFDSEKTFFEEFSSSGKYLKKAEGVIRLYNAYTEQNEAWREGTKFVSAEGKLFLSKSKINVPGAQLKNGKLTPSFVDVPVIAAEGGDGYNIGPSQFSILAYRGTPRYTKFYGESAEAMKGGGQAWQVTKDDLTRAETNLTEKGKTELFADLKNAIPKSFVFLDKAVETTVSDKSASAEVGAESEKFTFRIKIKAVTISFNAKDVEDFALLFMTPQIPEGKKLYQASLQTEYTPETFSLESQTLILSVKASGKIYQEINLDSLEKSVAGKSLNEAKVLLADRPEIIKSEVRLSPFWLGFVPDKLEKIKIELAFD